MKGENRIQRGMTFEQKFFRNIFPEPNSGCWLWGGYANQLGYGQIYVDGERKQAHRFSYELHNNQIIATDQFVCHKCNMPSCCNPNHLYIGTQSDNMMQAYKEKRFGQSLYEEIPIIQYDTVGNELGRFRSIMEASRMLGISQPVISRNIKNKGKTRAGYKFITDYKKEVVC